MIFRWCLVVTLLVSCGVAYAKSPRVFRAAALGARVEVTCSKPAQDESFDCRVSYKSGRAAAVLPIHQVLGSLARIVFKRASGSDFPLVVLDFTDDSGRDLLDMPQFLSFSRGRTGFALAVVPVLPLVSRSDSQALSGFSPEGDNRVIRAAVLLHQFQELHTMPPFDRTDEVRYYAAGLVLRPTGIRLSHQGLRDGSPVVVMTSTRVRASTDRGVELGPEPEMSFKDLALRIWRNARGQRILVR